MINIVTKIVKCPSMVFDFFYNEGVVLKGDLISLHIIKTGNKIIRVYETLDHPSAKLEIMTILNHRGKPYKLTLRYDDKYKFINRYYYDKFNDMIGVSMYRPQSVCYKKLKWGKIPKKYKNFRDINNEFGGCGKTYDMFACYSSKPYRETIMQYANEIK